jgi:hypothetical protein
LIFIDKIVEEYRDVLVAPMRVPPHYPVKQGYNRILHSLHVSSSPTESSHTQVDHAAILAKQIQPLQQQVHDSLQQAKHDSFFSKASNTPSFRFSRSIPISQGNLKQWGPLLPKGGGMIRMDLGGHPPFLANHHFEPMVLINHDIHPFGAEWSVMSYSFVNYRHHVMVLCRCLHDPKRIQRRIRKTKNLQRQLRMLKMASIGREREKIQSSQNSVKME